MWFARGQLSEHLVNLIRSLIAFVCLYILQITHTSRRIKAKILIQKTSVISTTMKGLSIIKSHSSVDQPHDIAKNSQASLEFQLFLFCFSTIKAFKLRKSTPAKSQKRRPLSLGCIARLKKQFRNIKIETGFLGEKRARREK